MAAWVGCLAAVSVVHAPAALADDTVLCRTSDPRLTEISGLAYSNAHEGIIWTHNDSGGGPKLYALDAGTCETVAVLKIRGMEAKDIEAIAAGVNVRGERVLWVADIGDNTASRRSVSIYEVREPQELRSDTVNATRYSLRYSTAQDAEALVADPQTDRLWLVSKGLIGGSLFAVPRPLWPRGVTTVRKVGEEQGFVTDAAMAPDGTRYAIRDYTEARIYRGRPPGTLVASVPLPEQIQGEAMTWTPDGQALVVASESDDRLLRVDVPAEARVSENRPVDSSTSAPDDTTLTTPLNAAVRPADRVGALAVVALAVGAGVFAVACLVVFVVALVRRRTPNHD